MRISAIIGFSLVLAACSTATPQAPKSCPRVAFVPDAGLVFHYLPGKTGEETALVSRAALVDYTGECTHDDGKVQVDMTLRIAAQPGPAAGNGSDGYDYFVAVLAPDGTALAKKVFHRSVEFDRDAKDNTNWAEEELGETIPLPGGADAGAFQIAIGFQLTPDELAFNRGHNKK